MRKSNPICSVSPVHNLDESRVSTLFLGNGENRFEFEIKHRLTVEETLKLVSRVCRGVIPQEGDVYLPELKDFYLRLAVLENYTNISLPEEHEGWELVYGTPIFAMITGHTQRPVLFDGYEYDDNQVIDVEQYEHIVQAIDEKINFHVRQKVLANVLRDGFEL